ncbi:peptidoglycan DD-metalloendopeptidase family protein [Flavobacteriaceae bacterium]|jgi:murein DD-endopeptidase MepM/ murein hydrolase activator NlpD|nr:peptidoglycan DD-metalloendopeptidase family protein [Cryomorphaceae bacterium]MDB3967608.1 peptidoglycan DD-metalloendopeptidase family protein [Flavobacteriaceae bacterium]MBT3688768.1 peptidoglycan DD-metalloendopeptidase family protein [Cryomorphaceae bacterium]MBT4222202.1 peptidoglycan DD-metalloendopeptidase family protein [Cryomorphaceae bacterium]MBT4293887.1 peptidoglycan DD-metalloendopeptidase family protein [Cryomorphaceae bacterium]|tara:strand:- start:239 stop:1483 length:1245 start_codon:yes stop_codon:yes gene_type:complete
MNKKIKYYCFFGLVYFFIVFLSSCASEINEPAKEESIKYRYGYDESKYLFEERKVRSGDTFGDILEGQGVDYPEIYQALQKTKNDVDFRKLQIGKPYTLIYLNDSIKKLKAFVYHPTIEGYSFIQLRDSVFGNTFKKTRTYKDLSASGIIDNSLYLTLEEQNKDPLLTYYLSDIYAWTIDFFRLDKGDKFKVIYTEAYVDDTIPVGITKIKAAYFVHRGIERYAFEYETDSIKGIVEYLDQDAKNLRRAFLQSPIKFGRISSRYNLRRRIAYYGNRVRPHKGTDFAAPSGTPILSTANGTIIESSYTRANGRYVKVKHNNTYSTQYLHMRKSNVKVGQFVEQGDVLGFVGMTGNTSGPHVCYRFWKNGVQVDPFKQKLPEAKPINESLKNKYFSDIVLIKSQLDSVIIKNNTSI